MQNAKYLTPDELGHEGYRLYTAVRSLVFGELVSSSLIAGEDFTTNVPDGGWTIGDDLLLQASDEAERVAREAAWASFRMRDASGRTESTQGHESPGTPYGALHLANKLNALRKLA
jgi:hypothetical protein